MIHKREKYPREMKIEKKMKREKERRKEKNIFLLIFMAFNESTE